MSTGRASGADAAPTPTPPPAPALSGLIGALADPDESVRRAAANSIVAIGASKPELVLPELLNSCKPSAKTTSVVAAAMASASAAADMLIGSAAAQRTAILRVAADVAREAQQKAPAQLPADVLLTAVVTEVDTCVDAEAASAAGDLLAELAKTSPHDAAQHLGHLCRAGTLPSPGVLRGLGELAQTSPPVMVPLLKSQLLPRLLPLLGAAKGDARIAFGIALHHFAEAVAAHDAAGITDGVGAASFASEMQSAVELLLAQWVPSRSQRVRDAAAEALGSMVVLLPASHMRALAPRLLPGLLAAQRREREDERFPITAALWVSLAHAKTCDLGRELHSENLLLPVLQALHGAVCAPYDRMNGSSLKNHNEELRCIEALGALAFEPTLTFLLAQLDGEHDANAHCGTLEVLRHLVQRLSASFEGRGAAVLTAINGLLPAAAAYKVRLAVVQLIGALGTRNFLQGDGGRPLLMFLLRQAALSHDECGGSGFDRRRHKASPEHVSAMEVKEAASKTLELLASTVPSMRHVLWALLLTPLLSDEYVYAAPIVCKMMVALATHFGQAEPAAIKLTIGDGRATPNYQAVLARLLSLASTLDWMPALSERSLQLLILIADQLHPVLPRLWSNHIPKLIDYLRSCAPALCDAVKPGGGGGAGGDASVSVGSGGGRLGEEWLQLCVHFAGDSLDAINAAQDGHEWMRALGHEMLSQLASPQLPDRLKAGVLSFLGPLLARTPVNAVLPHAIPAMLLSVKAADASSEAEIIHQFETGGVRLGCAVGMGGASASHFDAVVEGIGTYLRELAGPAPDSVADYLFAQVSSLISEQRPQHCVEADTATALLCLGHATAHASTASLGARATSLLTTIISSSKSARGEALRGCAARSLEHIAKVMCSRQGSTPNAQARDDAVELLLRFLAASLRGAYDYKMQLTAARRLQLPALHACALLVSLPPRAPAKVCATMVQSLLQLMQADVLAAGYTPSAPPEPALSSDGLVGGGAPVASAPVDLASVAEETYRHRQLMSVVHAVLGSLLAMRGPPPTGLFPLLAALLPLALSSYSLLRFRSMEAVSRLLKTQLKTIRDGGPLPEASLDAPSSESFGGAKSLSVLAAWHAFAAGKVNDALSVRIPGRAAPPEAAASLPDEDMSTNPNHAEPPPDPFSAAIGACTGMVLPRCSDPEARIRRAACQATHLLIQLATEARSRQQNGHIDEVLQRALAEAERVLDRCANAAVFEARIEAQRALLPCLLALLPPTAIDSLARSLIGGLDAEWSGAAAACVVLDGLLPHANSGGTADFVHSVLGSLLDVLPRIENQLVSNGALTVGASLATSDLDAVVRTLLAQPVPLGSAATSLTQRLAREPALLEKLLRALTVCVADEEAAPPASPTSDAAQQADTATALLQAIAEEEPEDLSSHRPAIFAALVLRMGAVRGVGGKAEQTICKAALALLETMTDVADSDGPDSMPTPVGDDGEAAVFGEETPLPAAGLVAALRTNKLDAVLYARSLARLTFTPAAMRRVPPEPHALFDRLHAYVTLRSEYVRETVLATVAELCITARIDASFTQQALHLLLRGLVDDAATVRVQALVGMRHLGATGALKQHLSPQLFDTALSTLAATLADPDVAVGLAAFAALVPALAAARTASVTALLASLSESSRAAVENDAGGPHLRAAGFETFAWLSRAAAEPEQSTEARAAFGEHCHALLPLLMLHAAHDDEALQRATLATLRALEPWFDLGESVLPAGAPGCESSLALSGPEWLRAMAALLTRSQPARLPRYIAACATRTASGIDDAHVRCQAVRLTGALLALTVGWETGEDINDIRAHAITQLVAALSDVDVDVRREAACALGSVGGV